MSTTGDNQRIPKSPHQPAGWTVSGLVVVVMCVFVGVYGLVGLLQDVLFQCPRSSVRVFGPTSGGFAGDMTGQQLMPKETITTSQEDTREISCAGKYVYLYDLPPAFNQKFVDDCRVDPPWVHICEALTNNGLGEPLVIDLVSSNDSSSFSNILLPRDAWYKTHQFTLDLYYHQRLKEYPCLTHDPDKAVLSYIPFYSALDLTLKLYNKSSLEKDRASQRLIGWLQSSRHWLRTGGHNHVLLFGRIIWDYTKGEFAADGWGNSLSKLTELQNVTKISIERAYYSQDQRAVPYPTSFHPYSDDQIVAWQRAVLSTRRDVLVVFAGAPRSKAPDMILVSSLRRQLMTQCSNSPRYCSLLSCNVVDCERSPHLLTQAFLKSVFCLQPRGDSATRKGVFDCLIAGSIPVFFSKYTAYRQYMWHLPHNGSSYSVFLDPRAVSNGTVNVIRELRRIPLSAIPCSKPSMGFYQTSCTVNLDLTSRPEMHSTSLYKTYLTHSDKYRSINKLEDDHLNPKPCNSFQIDSL